MLLLWQNICFNYFLLILKLPFKVILLFCHYDNPKSTFTQWETLLGIKPSAHSFQLHLLRGCQIYSVLLSVPTSCILATSFLSIATKNKSPVNCEWMSYIFFGFCTKKGFFLHITLHTSAVLGTFCLKTRNCHIAYIKLKIIGFC